MCDMKIEHVKTGGIYKCRVLFEIENSISQGQNQVHSFLTGSEAPARV